MVYRRTEQIIAKLAQNRRTILNAARALVAEGGFAAAQMTEVARRANVATGTLYRYFPSKEDLCRQVYREVAAREVSMLTGMASCAGSVSQRLDNALRLFVTRAARGRQMAHALLAEAVDPGLEAERTLFRKTQAEILGGLLQEGISSGEFPACQVQIVAACLSGAIASALVGPLAGSASKADIGDEAVEEVLRFCHAAIGASNR